MVSHIRAVRCCFGACETFLLRAVEHITPGPQQTLIFPQKLLVSSFTMELAFYRVVCNWLDSISLSERESESLCPSAALSSHVPPVDRLSGQRSYHLPCILKPHEYRAQHMCKQGTTAGAHSHLAEEPLCLLKAVSCPVCRATPTPSSRCTQNPSLSYKIKCGQPSSCQLCP